MSVKITQLTELQKELQFDIPAEQVEKNYQSMLSKEAQKAEIPGFRKGKVKPQDLEKLKGRPIFVESCLDLVSKEYQAAIAEHKILAVGAPQLKTNPDEFKRRQDLHCALVVEGFPTITLKDLNGEAIELLSAQIAADDVERELDRIRSEHTAWSVADKAAAKGDQVLIDFEGFNENNEAIPQAKADGFELVLGSGSMIPGFEDQFIGLKAGDEKTFTVTFPQPYHAPDLAGKPVTFKIKVQEVREKAPMTDEQLLEKIGYKKGGIAELKVELKTFLDRQLSNAMQNARKETVFDRLLKRNPIAIPQAAVNAEIQHLQTRARERIREQFPNLSPDMLKNLPLPKGEFIGEATRRVQLGFLIGQAIQAYKIEQDPIRVQAKLHEIADGSPNAAQMLAAYQSHPEWLSNIEEMVLEEAVLDRLLAQAKVTEKTLSYSAFLEEQAAAEKAATAARALEAKAHADADHAAHCTDPTHNHHHHDEREGRHG